MATADHLQRARRLAVSLTKANPTWSLTLYCDDVDRARRVLGEGPWDCVALASIGLLGAKRAKFDAYEHAVREGGFVWLDADIIVLDGLDELVTGPSDGIVACPDDLSECHFIADPKHPWPGDATLKNHVYFNSGVFAASTSLAEFFGRCASKARDDRQWQAWTIEGHLLDNHFLCAMVNLEGTRVLPVDARQFNWQGLRRGMTPMVRVVGGRLVNIETSLPLRLAHFAGIRDIDAWVRSLEPPVLAHFARAITSGDEDLLAALGATRAADLSEQSDAAISSGFSFARSEWLPPGTDGTPTESAIANAASVLSYVRSTAPSRVRWNGLSCGGAYLEAAEYQALRSIVRQFGIRTVLETGAGETSILFAREVSRVISIEPEDGPWAKRAREAGAEVSIVPLDSAGRFEKNALDNAIAGSAIGHVDLMYIDSPVGTHRRRLALDQLRSCIACTFIAFHDAHRDAELVLATTVATGSRLHAHLASWRGLVLLGPAEVAPTIPRATAGTSIAADIDVVAYDGKLRLAVVRIANVGDADFEAADEARWRLSYHIEGHGPDARWDNPRVSLPCSLEPGDVVELPISLSGVPAGASCWFDLVEEGKRWLSTSAPALAAKRFHVQ
jgi:hypothetical protein